ERNGTARHGRFGRRGDGRAAPGGRFTAGVSRMVEIARIPWHAADPELAERERERVFAVAPEMEWREDLFYGGRDARSGWVGPLPTWTADRPRPEGLDALLSDGP